MTRTDEQLEAIAVAAEALLHKIENMTTEEFSRGGEKPEREALEAALAEHVHTWGSWFKVDSTLILANGHPETRRAFCTQPECQAFISTEEQAMR